MRLFAKRIFYTHTPSKFAAGDIHHGHDGRDWRIASIRRVDVATWVVRGKVAS